MKLTIALFALLTATVIAIPVSIGVRDDTDPVMTNANEEVVPFDSTEVVTDV